VTIFSGLHFTSLYVMRPYFQQITNSRIIMVTAGKSKYFQQKNNISFNFFKTHNKTH